jgi:tyrosinase
MNRREVLRAAAVFAAAPYVLKFGRKAWAQTLRVRRNLSTIPAGDPFFTEYGEAIRKMHELPETDRRSWRGQALIHADFCPHGAQTRPDFVLWHRHYITYFERICGSLIGNPNFALPYWDWTANTGRLPQPFFDNGPLDVAFWNDRSDYQADNWGPDRINTRGRRAITATKGLRDDPRLAGSFTPTAITGILRQPNFTNFQLRLEGSPHNNGHTISGGADGHMVDGLSPLDPIFWLHHCNVDRLTAQWQSANNRIPQQNFTYNRQFVDETGAPQSVTAAQAMSFETMGFTYDLLTNGQAVAMAERPAAPAETEQSALAGLAVSQEVKVIGRSSKAATTVTNTETRIAVAAKKLVDNLFSRRVFRSPAPLTRGLAVEESRVLAKLTITNLKGATRQCLVNVFINCPYLSPTTPADDPHYAGSFSFFGQHYQHHGGVFLVDVSEPLRDQARQARLSTETVNVQVLPVITEEDSENRTEFTVSSVELISA